MKIHFNHIQRDGSKWSILLLIICLFVAIPTLTIFVHLLNGPGETWSHLVEHLLVEYVSNSVVLMLGASAIALVFGVATAWFVARFHFPFRKPLEWLLILPLAVPSYITAYAYAGIFDYDGFVMNALNLKIDVMNVFGLIFVLGLSLYPYVYVAARAFFLNQSYNILEASSSLGASESKTFFKLILPLARPAIVGGLILVVMEVLNDYGAAKYYGVNTFTTGIFRAWFSLEEPETAIYLSAMLLALIFGLILFEKWQRRRIGYFNSTRNHVKMKRLSLSRKLKIVLFLLTSVPVIFGFIIPFLQLSYWSLISYKEVLNSDFISIAFQSLSISFLAALVTVIFALLLIYLTKWNQLERLKNFAKIGVLGYAIPGAVIAVGVLIPTLALDKWLLQFFRGNFEYKIGFVINGTVLALLYAYIVRFLAVAHNPIEATSLKIGKSFAESSRILGRSNVQTFIKVEFPLLKKAVLSGFILVFVDVMKELPLTLILKPYSVNTLAVKAYEYASDEMIIEAALPSLFIIFTGVIPIILLNKLISNDA